MTDRTSTLAMLKKLIAFDTTSRNSNLELIYYIKDYLESLNIKSEIIFNDKKTKANILATIGPDCEGGIVLSGHSDVVPVDGQDWHTDPFILTAKDDKLYGRGTSDMKSFIAIILAILPELCAMKLSKPIHLAFSYDEEVGCLGAHSLVAFLKQHVKRPAFAVIGEPTELRVINSHKGIHSFKTTITGHEAHSSAVHKGVNAIAIAAELIHFLNTQQKTFIIHQHGNETAQRFDPPYTTLHVGTIHGGTARNIIPKHCEFYWEIRHIPGSDANQLITAYNDFARSLLPAMQKIAPEATIITESLAVVPSLNQHSDTTYEDLLLSLTGHNQAEVVSFGTEAGIFQHQYIPALICGPGSIMQAHKPNEYIANEQIDQGIAFVKKLVNTTLL